MNTPQETIDDITKTETSSIRSLRRASNTFPRFPPPRRRQHKSTKKHRRLQTKDLRHILSHFGGSGQSVDHHIPNGASRFHFLNRSSESNIGSRGSLHRSMVDSDRDVERGYAILHQDEEEDEEEQDDGVRFVKYQSNSHTSLMLQMHGSVWPRVFPYCIANTILLWIIIFWDCHVGEESNISVSSTVHSLTAMLLAFLVVQRSHMVYDRFMNSRHALENMNRICVELIQMCCIYSKQDRSVLAQNWRSRCAYTAIVLLRTTVAALEYRSTKLNAWDILPDRLINDRAFMTDNQQQQHQKEQQQQQQEKIEACYKSNLVADAPCDLGITDADFVKEALAAMEQDRVGHMLVHQRWAHGKRSVFHSNFCAPTVLAYRLRDCILMNREKVGASDENLKLHKLEEIQLTSMISQYVIEFHKLKADISTPFPFPLAQMARTFLFVWVYTLPFAVAKDVRNLILGSVLVFFATYGFVGLELISIELNDPFGDDPNDFDDIALAQMTFEDIYIILLKTDGLKRAMKLRETVKSLAKRSVQRVQTVIDVLEGEGAQDDGGRDGETYTPVTDNLKQSALKVDSEGRTFSRSSSLQDNQQKSPLLHPSFQDEIITAAPSIVTSEEGRTTKLDQLPANSSSNTRRRRSSPRHTYYRTFSGGEVKTYSASLPPSTIPPTVDELMEGHASILGIF